MKKIFLAIAIVMAFAVSVFATAAQTATAVAQLHETQTQTIIDRLSATPTPIPTATATSVTGKGSAAVEPFDIQTGQSGQPIQITYTAATANFVNGVFVLGKPAGWADFSPNTYNAGYITVTTTGKGAPSNVSIYPDKVVVVLPSLTIGQYIYIRYGNGSISVPYNSGNTYLNIQTASTTSNWKLAKAIATPIYLQVFNSKGAGSVSQLPTVTIDRALSTVFTWIYTADKVTITSGVIGVDKPTGWADFSTTNTNTGYIAVAGTNGTCGTPTVTANLMRIPVTSLSAGQVVTVKYGVSWTAAQATAVIGPHKFGFRVDTNKSVVANATPISTQIFYTLFRATSTPTITPTPSNASQTITAGKQISAGPCYLTSAVILARTSPGELYVHNSSSIAGVTAGNLVLTLSPTGIPSTPPYEFPGTGLYFDQGMVVYTKVTYASAVNNTINAYFQIK